MALLQEITCDLRHPMVLRHPVLAKRPTQEKRDQLMSLTSTCLCDKRLNETYSSFRVMSLIKETNVKRDHYVLKETFSRRWHPPVYLMSDWRQDQYRELVVISSHVIYKRDLYILKETFSRLWHSPIYVMSEWEQDQYKELGVISSHLIYKRDWYIPKYTFSRCWCLTIYVKRDWYIPK